VSTNGIDDGRLLANEQMSSAMEAQATLLLGRLGGHKAHVSPGDGFANRFRVSRIVLLSFDVRLDVGGRHQADRVTEHLKFTRPIMRRCTGLDANQARWQLLKERQNVSSLELTAHNYIAICIDTMNLKN
jgi:hypothetical protein